MLSYYRDAFARRLEFYFITKKFTGNGYILKFLRLLKSKPSSNMLVRTNYGFKLYIDPILDKGVERSIYNTGSYEDGALWVMSKILGKNDMVIDAGANIGLMTLFFSKTLGVKKVFSFEPVPETFKILEKNIKINKVSNVEAYPLALSNKEDKHLIYLNLNINRGAASLNNRGSGSTGIEVNVSSLNQLDSIRKFGKIDFCKIDVEGSELKLLQGSEFLFKQEIKPSLCIEYSRDVESNNSVSELYDFLMEREYILFKSKKGKAIKSPLIRINSKGDLPFHDNIYAFDSKILRKLPDDLF